MSWPAAVAAKKGGVRGLFLTILGLVFIGIGASLYYGELGVGSLTKNDVAQPGDAWAFLPIGLGVVLMIAGFAFAIFDRRAA
jgi:hypothetical protein